MLHMSPLGLDSPPLPPHGSITIGYGRDGGMPLRFSPQSRDGKHADAVFFKLFVSTKNISMYHVLQPSPLEAPKLLPPPPISHHSTSDPISRGVLTRMSDPSAEEEFWDVALAAVVISGSSKVKKSTFEALFSFINR
jgi:hypothetical protein